MTTLQRRLAAAAALVTSAALLGACASASGDAGGNQLSIVGFAVPESANKAIAATFNKTEAGKGTTFSGSYGASGDQSRKVEAGAKADYVHFSLEDDVTRLVKSGQVAANWNAGANKGTVAESVVVLVVPKGNPKNIQGWDDLVREDIEVITADPDSSGSARWNILGAYGHALASGRSEKESNAFLKSLFANVNQWAGSGREATEAFDNLIGDVLISYENEAILARQKGKNYEYIVPDTTLLIENPGVVLMGANPKAKAWLDFVLSKEGQSEFVKSGFRPVIDGVDDIEVEGANDPANPFPAPKNLLTIADDFGGWDAANTKFFDDGALVQQLRKEAAGK
ncbi:MAG TPA: sulfate ABC transporter substrate-binding protein [Aeromicrobium sp.]|nr:sulfate ABC transporter substrate-binding protein [Aeromicrobium sp.]